MDGILTRRSRRSGGDLSGGTPTAGEGKQKLVHGRAMSGSWRVAMVRNMALELRTKGAETSAWGHGLRRGGVCR